MREYFNRLKSHPGVPVASLMTILGCLAGASNENFPIADGMIFGGLVMGGFCWSIVLLSNFKSK
jgi:hypothetical protein